MSIGKTLRGKNQGWLESPATFPRVTISLRPPSPPPPDTHTDTPTICGRLGGKVEPEGKVRGRGHGTTREGVQMKKEKHRDSARGKKLGKESPSQEVRDLRGTRSKTSMSPSSGQITTSATPWTDPVSVRKPLQGDSLEATPSLSPHPTPAPALGSACKLYHCHTENKFWKRPGLRS